MKLVNLLYLLKRFIFKTGNQPAYFIYFVTGKCPLSCQHCFNHLREYSSEELNLEEIEKFSRKMGRIAFLLLTGGEPFSRSDFERIPGIFYRNTGVRSIAIPTNGFLTDEVIGKVKFILKECSGATVTVNVSLDGLGKLHDKIRRREGTFLAAVKTCKELVALRDYFPNFDVGVCTVVSTLNENNLEEIYKFVTKELDIRIWTPFLTRGAPRNPETIRVNMQKYKRIGDFMKTEIKHGNYKGYINFPLNTAKNSLRRDIIYRIKQENKMIGSCYAGRLIGMMFPDGQVKPCEVREDIFGNIRDFDWDFRTLWRSKHAEEVRRKIKLERCFCTHECVLTMNLFFNPRFLWGLIKERLRIPRYES